MTTITVTRVMSDDELYHRYPGETSAQPVAIYLDCATGELGARYSPEIGQCVPSREWHGHVQAWTIPTLKARAANALLGEIAPLAQRVCDGYTRAWNGSNHVADFDEDAAAALDAIEALCDASGGEGDELEAWDACDWLGPVARSDEGRCSVLGISAETDDAALAAIESNLADEAAADGIVVDGLGRYLETLRQGEIDRADEAAE